MLLGGSLPFHSQLGHATQDTHTLLLLFLSSPPITCAVLSFPWSTCSEAFMAASYSHTHSQPWNLPQIKPWTGPELVAKTSGLRSLDKRFFFEFRDNAPEEQKKGMHRRGGGRGAS